MQQQQQQQQSPEELINPSNITHGLLKYSSGDKGYTHWIVHKNHSLRPLLRRLPQTFAVDGSISKFWSIESLFDRDDSCTLEKPDINQILNEATPSSFGKGSEAVFDQKIRQGAEIPANKLNAVNIEGWILDNLECNQTLFHDSFDVKLYKLAIYTEGGHFQSHRDTVHSADHKATLLVEIPTSHEGGDLILTKDGKEVRWKLGEEPQTTDKSEDLLFPETEIVQTKPTQHRWCMFFTDVEHQVEPVTKGVRMVLQFDVFVKETSFHHENDSNFMTFKDSSDHNDYPSDGINEYDVTDFDSQPNMASDTIDIFERTTKLCNSGLHIAKQEVLDKIIEHILSKLPKDHGLAIPLFYQYTSQTIVPGRLKDIDHDLYQALLHADLTVGLTPIRLVSTTNEVDHPSILSFWIILLDDFPIFFREYEASSDTVLIKKMPYWPSSAPLTYVATGFENVKHLEYKDIIPTGNEPTHWENHYFAGAMIVFNMKAGKEKIDKMK